MQESYIGDTNLCNIVVSRYNKIVPWFGWLTKPYCVLTWNTDKQWTWQNNRNWPKKFSCYLSANNWKKQKNSKVQAILYASSMLLSLTYPQHRSRFLDHTPNRILAFLVELQGTALLLLHYLEASICTAAERLVPWLFSDNHIQVQLKIQNSQYETTVWDHQYETIPFISGAAWQVLLQL